MAQVATVTVKRVKDSGQFCAELRSYYNNIFVYGSSPSDALRRLVRHSLMAEVYRPRVAEVKQRHRNWQISDADLSAGVPLTTIIPTA